MECMEIDFFMLHSCFLIVHLPTCAMSVVVLVNGKKTECQEHLPLGNFLVALGMSQRRIVVEHNRKVIPRALYTETLLHHGDEIEIIEAIGGG